jgi:pilus assembly protein CpaF
MNLADRLAAARGGPPADAAPAPGPALSAVPAPRSDAFSRPAASAPRPAGVPGGAGAQPPPTDALSRLKDRVGKALFERMGSRMNDPGQSEEALRTVVLGELDEVVDAEKVPLSPDERQRLISELVDDVLGFGPLQRLLDDGSVTEIMVNGPDMIYVEQNGRLQRTSARFTSEEHLRRVIDRIVSRVGRRIDESSPLVDARLADGSRVNAIIPPLAFSGSTLTIRKFSKDPFTVDDLLGFGTLSPEMAELLRACVEARLNVIVSGGTGTGKTTLDACSRWHT